MGKIRPITELNVKGKKVLVRVDFNVPMEKGSISDDTRIKAAIPTIKYLIDNGADKTILISHLGRPEGKTPSLTLKPIADRLSSLLNRKVIFLSDCIGDEIEKEIKNSDPGSVILLENIRFYPAEEKPKLDPSFVEKLARLGDAYVNDAFGTAHRAHASTAVIAKFFPLNRACGFLMMKEIEALGSHLTTPERPFTAIIGGAKVSSKLGVLKSLLSKVDTLLIGGAMSYTFMKARGVLIGKSLVEDDMVGEAQAIEKLAKEKGVLLLLPIDVVVTQKIEPSSPSSIVSLKLGEKGIPDNFEGVDIGPETITSWAPYIRKSKTIFWNGPVGVFEVEPFNKGTNAIAQLIAELKGKCYTIVGGGDSVSALEKSNLQESISHVSTGGGASLEFIEQGQLPGLQALEE